MKGFYLLITVIILSYTGFSQTITPPQATFSSFDTITICSGASTTLSVVVTDGTSPYTVTVTDGTNSYSATGESPVSISVNPSDTSTYSIVSVIGGDTGTVNSGTLTVNVKPRPPAPTGLACYQTIIFDSTEFCQWDIIGVQPTAPTVACYESADFDTHNLVKTLHQEFI